jgi:hypothetical protein
MANDKWIKRWAVRSSSGKGDYIISTDAEGNYGCSCSGWTLHIYCPYCYTSVKKEADSCGYCGRRMTPVRHDCAHIRTVKANGGRSIGEATIDRMLGR